MSRVCDRRRKAAHNEQRVTYSDCLHQVAASAEEEIYRPIFFQVSSIAARWRTDSEATQDLANTGMWAEHRGIQYDHHFQECLRHTLCDKSHSSRYLVSMNTNIAWYFLQWNLPINVYNHGSKPSNFRTSHLAMQWHSLLTDCKLTVMKL
jgi:hypothetical protein